MRAIETNVLVRLIARDDSRQTASAESLHWEGRVGLGAGAGRSHVGA
jgi:hypothetical protein